MRQYYYLYGLDFRNLDCFHALVCQVSIDHSSGILRGGRVESSLQTFGGKSINHRFIISWKASLLTNHSSISFTYESFSFARQNSCCVTSTYV